MKWKRFHRAPVSRSFLKEGMTLELLWSLNYSAGGVLHVHSCLAETFYCISKHVYCLHSSALKKGEQRESSLGRLWTVEEIKINFND